MDGACRDGASDTSGYHPETAPELLRHAVGELVRRVPVADRRIALLPERVVRQLVARQVVVDVLVVPVDDRVDLQIAVLHPEHVQMPSRRGLRAPEPDDPRDRVELVEGTLHRLDLVHLVVRRDAVEPMLPALAEARLLPRGAERRAALPDQAAP